MRRMRRDKGLLLFTLLLGLVSFLAIAFPLQHEASVLGVLGEESLFDECTAGVADGRVTVDGRPLLWKLRNQVDITNDVHYFAAGVEHHPGLGPAAYSYLGMGPANDGPEGPVRQGLNAEGLAAGFNVLEHGGWQELHHQALGHYDQISQVRTYLNGMTDLSTYNYFLDASGQASLWESQTGTGRHWEYNTRAPARDGQWIDVDGADGDGDRWTGGDASFSGWVVRANAPAHYNADGSDDASGGGRRYRVARDTIAALIYNRGDGTALSAKSLAGTFFRDDVLALDTTVSNMIVHGVLPTEDPRLSTMWTLLGHSKTGIFVPVWLHGVESDGLNDVPRYLDSGDDGLSVYAPARGMFADGYNIADVQARTLPFERHLFDVVNDRLLPAWRARDWADAAEVAMIGQEMKRVQEQMDADAYAHLQYLYDQGPRSNYAPAISLTAATADGLEATFSVRAEDADHQEGGGGNLTYHFNYGDGQTGSRATHGYAQPGRYLVSCTVTDEHGVSQTDWLFVMVGEPSCDDGLLNQGKDLIDCGGPCTPCACVAIDDGYDGHDGIFCTLAGMSELYRGSQIVSVPSPPPFESFSISHAREPAHPMI